MSRPPGATQLIARGDELARIDSAFEAAAGGEGCTVVVTGDAGIGKTRLIKESAQRADEQGASVLLGRCLDLVGAGVPYLAIAEALRPLPSSPFAAGAPSGRRRLSVYSDVRQVLEREAETRPVVLVVEDIHWADVSTLDLLSYVATSAPELRLLLVVTARVPEMGQERTARWLDSSRRNGATTVLELGPLTRGQLGELLPADLPAPVADAVFRRSGGNPFLAQELASTSGDLPAALRETLLRPVAGLPGDAVRAARTVAASGGALGHEVLASALRLPPERLRRALRSAVDAYVLVVEDDVFGLRHALVAEAIYGALLPGERQETHAALATALAERGAPAGEVAHHWAAAGVASEAFRMSLVAAQDAAASAGPAEALAHLERALALWDTVDSAGWSRADLLAAAAEHADDIGQGQRAAVLVREAIALLDEATEPARVALLYERLGSYLLPIGDRVGGLAACRRAVELVAPSPPSRERVRVLSALGHAYMLSGQYAEACRLSEEAIAVARAMGEPERALRADDVRGLSLCYLGQFETGLAVLAAACARQPDRAAPERLIRPYVFYSDSLLLAGRHTEALDVSRAGFAFARSVGHESSVGNVLTANEVEALLGLGEWDAALEVLTAALDRAGDYWSHHLHLWYAMLATGRGEFDLARDQLALADSARDEPTAAPYHAMVTAELALATGRPRDAIDAVTVGLDGAESVGRPTLAVRLGAAGRRAAAELPTVDGAALIRRARSAARTAGTPEAESWLALAEAEDAGDPTMWREAARRWSDLGRPYQGAYCDWRLAEALVAVESAGSRPGKGFGEATEALRRAHEVATRLGAAPLRDEVELLALRARLHLRPPPVQTSRDEAGALGLTAREAEVLRLLALGYTNRDIASELTISVKTASVHVSNILRKLNVPGRVQAAAFARKLPAR
jgi:DNA-binding CsgD family transcriptional regulator